MSERPILIIGAGLGGLVAALALLRRGFSVRVFEQSAQLGEVGAGIMITPNVTKVLAHLGLERALEQLGLEPEASVYRRFDTAELMAHAPLKERMMRDFGARYFHIHRADLHAMLVAAARALDPQVIRLGHHFVGLEREPSSLIARFADGTRAEGEALIGADGIRSTVRAVMFESSPPRFTGQIAWRGLVPAAGLPSSVTAPVSTAWIGPHRHIIQYRLRGGAIINYVAIVASDAWVEESWTCRSEVAEVVAEFAGWHPDVGALLRATHPDQCIKWGLFDREPLDNWVSGRVALLGDAAHPMLPFMAQGAAMAIEDGCLLARARDAAASIEEALTRYQGARRERANWVVLQSRAATALYQSIEGNKAEERQRNITHLYGYDATTTTV